LPAAQTLPSSFPDRPALQAIVVDPGHGGDDPGVTVGEIAEKQITLDVARRVRALVEGRLGIHVTLTRDEDRPLSADERAAAANNSAAGLFLSLHLNAAFGPSSSGAAVAYASLARDTPSGAPSAEPMVLPGPYGSVRTVTLVPWDLAQRGHIEASAALAGVVEAALREQVPMSPRPLRRAPLRALTGVNMPAVLVEMAYLTNPDQAAAIAGQDFQSRVADALFNAVVRYRTIAGGPP
ncbi:MAG: N-acetylmuramoyl-L-alanine amidase, partial [Candidatus Sericytochromatia bacterium]|nr:N-acetylmuramoyl-L-alanine amidase [Candidatus Tanganyikabacteria bacterium]